MSGLPDPFRTPTKRKATDDDNDLRRKTRTPGMKGAQRKLLPVAIVPPGHIPNVPQLGLLGQRGQTVESDTHVAPDMNKLRKGDCPMLGVPHQDVARLTLRRAVLPAITLAKNSAYFFTQAMLDSTDDPRTMMSLRAKIFYVVKHVVDDNAIGVDLLSQLPADNLNVSQQKVIRSKAISSGYDWQRRTREAIYGCVENVVKLYTEEVFLQFTNKERNKIWVAIFDRNMESVISTMFGACAEVIDIVGICRRPSSEPLISAWQRYFRHTFRLACQMAVKFSFGCWNDKPSQEAWYTEWKTLPDSDLWDEILDFVGDAELLPVNPAGPLSRGRRHVGAGAAMWDDDDRDISY